VPELDDGSTEAVVVASASRAVAIVTGEPGLSLGDPEHEVEMSNEQGSEKGPKYFVNVEGVERPWSSSTITVPEIRELGGWDASQPVVEVDLEDQSERTLAEDAVVTLKPGHGFAKKIRFQRGR
jgi:hypothetical protein